MLTAPLPDLDTLNAAALKSLIVSQHEQLSSLPPRFSVCDCSKQR
jgi:hypothetical protein